MAWIESHTVLLRHRKLIELAKELGIQPVYALGHIHALWYAAMEQQEDGDLTSWSDAFIAESAEYSGDAAAFVSFLQKHGWLDGRLLHDWLDYAGKYLTARYRTANPKKLKQIYHKHKSVFSRTKVGKQSTRDAIGLGNQEVSQTNGESPRGEAAPPVADDRVLIGGVPYRWPSPEGFVALSLDPETWNSFVDYRRTIREPLTPHAEKLAGKKLAELRALGQDAKAVIEQSILNHWSGLFPVKNGRGGETKSDALRKKTQEILKRGLE